jgi:hypothetical protein
MIKTESKTVDGIQVTTTQLPAMRAFKLFFRLVRLIGPALGAFGDFDPKTDLKEVMKAMSPSFMAAFSSLDPEEATALACAILENTVAFIPGQGNIQLNNQAALDIVFSGRVKAMLNVVVFAVQVNFSDFFDGDAPAVPASVPGPVANSPA